jgi:cellulose synthase/poly-beta-1,6-N-acetylglucosamine synthase-like glycosyltransferase
MTGSADQRIAIGVPATAVEDDLPATLASLYGSAVAAGRPIEVIVAVNGPGEPAPAVAGVEAFARAHRLPLVPAGAAPPPAGSCVRLLRLAPQSKVAAWNAIRDAARAPVIVFADADVRVAPAAIPLLLARLDASPELAVVAGREAALLTPEDGVVARVAALPHRFDFGNVPGRLYALRTAALPEPMPAHVLHEDAYLSVRLGRERFAKEHEAIVYLRPPTTWRDYLRQRVRNEVGKLQLTHEFPELHRAHGFGRYPWRRFVREIAPREYPLVALSMAARVFARVRALRQIKQGFRRGWAVLPSTKRWPAGGGA